MGKFKYFAYGSNLLKERIHLNNPSAVKVSIGKIDGFRLDFNYFSKRWQGAAATIEEDSNQHVWGVIWELDEQHMQTLDHYQLITPAEPDRRPSAVYKDVIVRGATDSGLPDAYLRFLADIEDNGYRGEVEVALDLSQR